MLNKEHFNLPLFFNFDFNETIGKASINEKYYNFLGEFPCGFELHTIVNKDKGEIIGLSISPKSVVNETKDTKIENKNYSTYQAAKLLGVSLSAITNWVNDGKINCVRTPGGHRRIPPDEIRKLVKIMDHLELKSLGGHKTKNVKEAIKRCEELIKENE